MQFWQVWWKLRGSIAPLTAKPAGETPSWSSPAVPKMTVESGRSTGVDRTVGITEAVSRAAAKVRRILVLVCD